jgi:hypothetical protein
MRLATIGLLALGSAAVVLTGSALAGGKEEPKPSVSLARTWEKAIEEAKTLNVPIVVHNHGFYCPPCWGMHASVMHNEKYIDFANENTVEVVAQQDLQKGIDEGKDKRGGMYDAKDENGKPVKYMLEWPGLTLEEMLALHSSPASTYNKSGGIPYTAIVDPHTLQEMKGLRGGQSAKTVMEEVLAAKEVLNKSHGPSLKRATLKKVEAGVKNVEATLEKSGSAKALAEFAKLEDGVAKEPDALKAKLTPVKEKLVAAAAADLDKAEGLLGSGDAKGATALLNPLKSALKGTELEAKLKELLDKAKTSAEPAK